MKKMLVVYYSWSNGNTERVARMLAEAAGADICRIETKDPYPEDYDETVALAKRQVEAGFEPELEPLEEDLGSYDAVAVGSPLWWYTMAPAVRSFLVGQSWEGKTVIPFVTDAGWPGTALGDMESLAEPAKILEPLEVRFDSGGGSRMVTSPKDVEAWVRRVSEKLA